MYPAAIEDYVRPTSVADALQAAGKYAAGEAMFIAGGQSLMQAVKSRLVRPRCVIDLQAVDAKVPSNLADAGSSGSLRDEMERLEQQRIVDALEQCNGNQTQAAKLLGISRRVLMIRMSRYGLKVERSIR